MLVIGKLKYKLIRNGIFANKQYSVIDGMRKMILNRNEKYCFH